MKYSSRQIQAPTRLLGDLLNGLLDLLRRVAELVRGLDLREGEWARVSERPSMPTHQQIEVTEDSNYA